MSLRGRHGRRRTPEQLSIASLERRPVRDELPESRARPFEAVVLLAVEDRAARSRPRRASRARARDAQHGCSSLIDVRSATCVNVYQHAIGTDIGHGLALPDGRLVESCESARASRRDDRVPGDGRSLPTGAAAAIAVARSNAWRMMAAGSSAMWNPCSTIVLTASASPSDSTARLEHVCALEEVDPANVRGSLRHPEAATLGGERGSSDALSPSDVPVGHPAGGAFAEAGSESDAPGARASRPGPSSVSTIRMPSSSSSVQPADARPATVVLLPAPVLPRTEVRPAARTDGAGGMEHQVAPHGDDPRHRRDRAEGARRGRGSPVSVGDERHAFPAELERRPARELDGESVADPVFDRPGVVRVVNAAVSSGPAGTSLSGARRYTTSAGRAATDGSGSSTRTREHEAVD